MVVIPLTVLAVLVACVGSLLRPRWDLAVVTALLGLIWTRVNGTVEGRVLYVVTPDRGFTEADVLAAFAVAVAGWALLRCAAAAVRGRAAGPAAVAHQGP